MYKITGALLLCLLLPLNLFAQTLKAKHDSINLRANPGTVNTKKIGSVGLFEEVEILRTVRLKNGEKWYKISSNQHLNWKKSQKIGWVRADLFFPIADPTSVDEPSEANVCANCDDKSSITSRQTDNLSAIRTNLKNRKKEKFIWPVSGVLKSGFGNRRHPIHRVIRLHNGLDISGNAGRKVVAAKSGKVTVSKGNCRTGAKKCNRGAGNMVTIDHLDGTATRYLHLSPSCKLPRAGSKINQGQPLGCVGNTGSSTGPHLHFSVLVNNKLVNPLKHLPKRGR